MPKTAKPLTNTNRVAPYSVPTAVPIAPASTMTPHQPRSPSRIPADEQDSKIWSHENDERLIRARARGLNWQPIADQYFPNKSANACRKRHERLMEKRKSNDDWRGPKMEAVAQAYYEVREQMWRILADRVGDKWQNVEQKCMEKGLKNLNTAGRAASRRQQLSGNDLDQATHSPYQQPQQDRSGSHQNEGDDRFNDSGLGHEHEHHYFPSNHNEHQQSYTSGIHTEPAQYTAGVVTPSPSSRSYSVSSSAGYPPNISPYQPMPQSLPSFTSTFGPSNVLSPNRR